MDKKDYTIINNAKNTIPEFGDTFEKCKKEHYKTLSIASHELLNHISFLNSSYDLISKTYPETKNMRFWNSMGTSIYEITNMMKRLNLCRYCTFPNKENVTLNDLIYQLPDEADNAYPDSERRFRFDIPTEKININADKEQLLIAFNEIVSNCYEAGNDNDIIDISASLSDDKTHCTITFTNTGTLPDIKIPKEFRQICTKDFYYPDDINILSMAFYTTKPGHFSHGLIRQYLRNYGVIPIKGVTPFLYLSGFFRFFLFYSFHYINKLLLCWDVK